MIRENMKEEKDCETSFQSVEFKHPTELNPANEFW